MPIPRFIANPLLPALSFVLHHAPFKTRLGGISTVLAKVLGLYSMTQQREAVLRNGIRLPVRLSDYNGRMLYLFGTPDPKIITICRSLLRPGDVFLDIGANFGTVGLLSADKLGAQGELHFVEPQPELCAAIRDGIAQANIPNASVHNCGMWDEDGELELSRLREHTGAASFANKVEDGEKFTVPVLSTQTFLREQVRGRAFAAKVDVEGAEPKILPVLLSDPNLRFLLFECNNPAVREHTWELIQSKQISFLVIMKHLLSTRLRLVESKSELERAHDVLAVNIAHDQIPSGEFHPSKLATLFARDGAGV